MWLTPVNGHDIKKRTALFSKRIVRLYKAMPNSIANQTMGKQVLRAGTSVGAQVAEATFAKSRADLISKLQGALQESEETHYWLTLIVETEIFSARRMQDIMKESSEITAIIAAIINKSTRRNNKSY